MSLHSEMLMNDNPQTIRFHLKTGDFGWLSNFAHFPIEIDGLVWPTSEHYYQGSKFTHDPEWMEAIRTVIRPYDAWRMGRRPEHPPRTDWHDVKDEIMLRAVRAKFNQHPNLQQALLATGEAVLVEHSPQDSYWGDGGDGSGQNRLGKILMLVRLEIGLRLGKA
jgi:ribA/ribD-fused uncharacterized protein